MQIEEFKEIRKGSLLGFARVRLPSGMIFHDVGIYQKEDRVWASPSSKPKFTRDGQQLRDRQGKALYAPVVSFVDRATQDRFSSGVIEALREAHPEVFDRRDAAE